LLAPGNIPALENKADSRFLICTTAADWEAVQQAPNFARLLSHIGVIHLEMPVPRPEENKMLVMSAGHARMSQMCFEHKAVGVYVTPDLVVSDGTVTTLQRRVREGKDVVLVAAVRFSHEGCIPELTQRGFLQPGSPMAVTGRELMGIALRHLHSETQCYEWSADYFTDYPIACFWRVPDGSGIILYSFSWAPLALNYAAIESHDTSTFQNWTLDGDYVNANFGNRPGRVYVVCDSDEIAMVSFTKESELNHELLPYWYCGVRVLDEPIKIRNLRRIYNSDVMDPLKRGLFPARVAWHGGPIDPAVWEPLGYRADALVSIAINPPTTVEWLWLKVVDKLRVTSLWPFSRLNRGRSFPPIRAVNRRHLNQAGIGSVRTLPVGPPLSSGRWYWEVRSPNLGAAGPEVAASATFGVIDPGHSMMKAIGAGGRGWGWRGDGVKVKRWRVRPCGKPADGVDQVVMIALDPGARKIWFGLNGTWFNGGDPARAVAPAFDGVPQGVCPALSSRHGAIGTAELHARVTAETLAYPVPEGFKPLADAPI
jgi:hypothetical protein